MSERYVKLFTGDVDLYSDNSPIIIRACALLKDIETGKSIAQLKLQNLGPKTISYVKAIVTPFDTIGAPLGV